jgi:hypothetical protein
LIANETEYARRCLEQGYIDTKKPYKSIRTVVRYLNRICGIVNIDDLYSAVQSYIDETGKVVVIDKNTILQMRNEDNPYNQLESISLSSKELYMIMNNDYPHSWRKVLFVMLVHYKTKKAIYTDVDNRRVDSDLSSIMSDAHTTLSVEKRMQMMAKFEEDGYIEMPNGGKQAKYLFLNYIDEEPQDELVVISDFFDFYLYFEQYVKGGRLIYCQECGKLVHIVNKQDNSKKYCKKCAKEIENEKTLERVKKHNRKNKN